METPEARQLTDDPLREIDAAARVVEFTETPGKCCYSARVEILDEVPTILVLPPSLVLAASTGPSALQTLRDFLRAEIRRQRSRIGLNESHEGLAEDAPESICPGCSKPIRPGESVRFQHGQVFHLHC